MSLEVSHPLTRIHSPVHTQHPSPLYQDVGAKSAPVSIDPRWTSHDSGHGGEEMEPSEPVLEVNGLGAGASAGAGVDIDAHPLTLENGLGSLEMPTPSPRFEPVKTVRWRAVGRGSWVVGHGTGMGVGVGCSSEGRGARVAVLHCPFASRQSQSEPRRLGACGRETCLYLGLSQIVCTSTHDGSLSSPHSLTTPPCRPSTSPRRRVRRRRRRARRRGGWASSVFRRRPRSKLPSPIRPTPRPESPFWSCRAHAHGLPTGNGGQRRLNRTAVPRWGHGTWPAVERSRNCAVPGRRNAVDVTACGMRRISLHGLEPRCLSVA